jgi:hypothetical protein
MNVKTLLLAALVTLGTISFPETADARPQRGRHYRQYHHHPQYYQRQYRRSRGYYYYPRDYYYGNRYYHPYRYRYPYRYRRGTEFHLQYGPLTLRGWR